MKNRKDGTHSFLAGTTHPDVRLVVFSAHSTTHSAVTFTQMSFSATTPRAVTFSSLDTPSVSISRADVQQLVSNAEVNAAVSDMSVRSTNALTIFLYVAITAVVITMIVMVSIPGFLWPKPSRPVSTVRSAVPQRPSVELTQNSSNQTQNASQDEDEGFEENTMANGNGGNNSNAAPSGYRLMRTRAGSSGALPPVVAQCGTGTAKYGLVQPTQATVSIAPQVYSSSANEMPYYGSRTIDSDNDPHAMKQCGGRDNVGAMQAASETLHHNARPAPCARFDTQHLVSQHTGIDVLPQETTNISLQREMSMKQVRPHAAGAGANGANGGHSMTLASHEPKDALGAIAGMLRQGTTKPIVLYLVSSSCGYCKLLMEQIDAMSRMAHVITVDAEKYSELLGHESSISQQIENSMKQNFQGGVPYGMIIAPDGHIAGEILGYTDANGFASELRKSLQNHYRAHGDQNQQQQKQNQNTPSSSQEHQQQQQPVVARINVFTMNGCGYCEKCKEDLPKLSHPNVMIAVHDIAEIDNAPPEVSQGVPFVQISDANGNAVDKFNGWAGNGSLSRCAASVKKLFQQMQQK